MVDEASQDALGCEPLEVGAWLAQPLAEALNLTDPEPPPNECVQVDTARNQIAPRLCIAKPPTLRQHQLVEDLRLDQSEVVAASAAIGWGERAGLGCVPVPC